MSPPLEIVIMALNPRFLAAAAVVLTFAGLISLWLRYSYGGYGLLERINKADKGYAAAMVLLALVYFAVYAWLSVHRYHKVMLGARDLGIFESLFANALDGRFFRDYRGPFDHFSPLAGVFLPFYAVWRDPRVLLVLQTAVIVLAVWPLYLLAREASGRALYGAVAGMLYLLYPLVGSGNLYDLHAAALSPLMFFSMLLFMVRERWGLYWLFAVLLMCVTENEPVLVFGAGLYLLTRRRHLQGALSLAAAAAWVIAVTRYVMPAITGAEFRHFARYETIIETARWMATDEAGRRGAVISAAGAAALTLFVVLPTGFAAMRRWYPFFFLVLPALAANALSATIQQRLLVGHYGFTVASAVLGAVALGMYEKTAPDAEKVSTRPVFLVVVAVLCNVLFSFPANARPTYSGAGLPIGQSFNFLSLPLPIRAERRSFYRVETRERFIFAARDFFPEGAAVAAQNNVGSLFAGSHRLMDLDDPALFSEADFVLCDLRGGHRVDDSVYENLIERLDEDERFVRFLDMSRPDVPDCVFFAAGEKWRQFYDNAMLAHRKRPDDMLASLALYAVENTMGLPHSEAAVKFLEPPPPAGVP